MTWNLFDFSDCRSHAEIDAKRNTGLFALWVFAVVLFAMINIGNVQ